MITIQQYNSVYVHVTGEQHEVLELRDFLLFKAPGYQFMPRYRSGIWNGDINLYSLKTNLVYAGLVDSIIQWANDSGYQVDYQREQQFGASNEQIIELAKKLQIPHELRDYQLKTIVESIQAGRATNLSPTGSGKSLMIYILARYYQQKCLIIVPNTSLVEQLAADFVDYRYLGNIDKIYNNSDRVPDADITISTWQSLVKAKPEFFNSFGTIIVDEVHHAKAKSLTDIMEKATSVEHRFGFTGTLDGTAIHKLIVEGLFGPVIEVTTTHELMNKQVLAELNVKCVVLKYDQKTCEQLKHADYQDEIQFLNSHQSRSSLICNLASKLPGNTFVLFDRVETHGKILYQMLTSFLAEKQINRKVYYIDGSVAVSDRESIRNALKTENNAIIIASVKTFSTGINVPSLNNIIAASPTKSRIRLLQSVGRVLRRIESKNKALLIDIADDLSYRKHKNYTLKHFLDRVQIYNEQQFSYTIHKMEIATNGKPTNSTH